MAKICPKCSYPRQPEDRAPDYECPRCGIIYAKFEASQRAAPAPAPAPPASAPKKPGYWAFLPAVIVSSLLFGAWRHRDMLMEKLDLGPAPRVLELLRFECQTLPDQTVEVSGRVGNIGTRPLRLNTWIILDREGATQADTFRTHGKVGEQAVPPGGALEFKFSFFFPEDFAERCTVDTFVDEESGKVVPYTNKTGRGRKTS